MKSNPIVLIAIAGGVFVVVALTASWIKRMPLSTSVIYITVGWLIGPHCGALLNLDPVKQAGLIRLIAELALIISLFSAGLKLRSSFFDENWRVALRMAFLSMAITIGLVATTAHYIFHVSWGAGFLIGSMLAVTDPVLASDVAVDDPFDPGMLRFGLTGEAGLNDGAAFPFYRLGIGLMAADVRFDWAHWVLWDVLWGVFGGVAIGVVSGLAIGELMLYLRRRHGAALGLGFLLVPGLTLMTYGAAQLSQTYGFLAVFCDAVALRSLELRERGRELPVEERELAISPSRRYELATHPKTALAYLLQGLLVFSEQLEEIGEAVVVTIAGIIFVLPARISSVWLLLILFLAVRPISVITVLFGSSLGKVERGLAAWFGIKGAGTIYYLMLALAKGMPAEFASDLVGLTTTAVVVSIAVHGLSVTPLMKLYSRRKQN